MACRRVAQNWAFPPSSVDFSFSIILALRNSITSSLVKRSLSSSSNLARCWSSNSAAVRLANLVGHKALGSIVLACLRETPCELPDKSFQPWWSAQRRSNWNCKGSLANLLSSKSRCIFCRLASRRISSKSSNDHSLAKGPRLALISSMPRPSKKATASRGQPWRTRESIGTTVYEPFSWPQTARCDMNIWLHSVPSFHLIIHISDRIYCIFVYMQQT